VTVSFLGGENRNFSRKPPDLSLTNDIIRVHKFIPYTLYNCIYMTDVIKVHNLSHTDANNTSTLLAINRNINFARADGAKSRILLYIVHMYRPDLILTLYNSGNDVMTVRLLVWYNFEYKFINTLHIDLRQ
jgi:hypothetical protein